MQLDGSSLTTPEVIDQKVASFCRKLSGTTPIFVEVRPESWCRQSCCEMNVEKLIKQQGGDKVIGYKIWYKKNKYIEAERHVIYKHGDALRDLTFNSDGETKILFVPDTDTSKDYESRPMKIREGFSQRARLLVKQLDDRDRRAVRMSNEESWERMLTYEAWQAGERMPNMWIQAGG
ncbi:hypothetical protein NB705_001708 [Xanthomonas sacchari]|nr:hypothetical protein [Xanthomonas sacchari]